MNLPIAVPGHVGEDGVWLEFVAPDGKRVLVRADTIAEMLDDGPTESAAAMGAIVSQWVEAQMAAYRAANKG